MREYRVFLENKNNNFMLKMQAVMFKVNLFLKQI